MTDKLQILFPVGRVVMGSLSEPQTKDADGRPLVIKEGPDAGKPTQKFFFAVAIPKLPGHTHWSHTEWGGKIWALGHAAWPQGQANALTFAWKIQDGDSAVPNGRGKPPNKNEGFPGCWVVSFSSSYAVKTYDARGSQAVDPKSIKLGHYVEVFGTIDSNNSMQKPGVYINHSMVAHAGFGPEIVRGPDASAVGFGAGALPPGASATPPPSMQPPPSPATTGVPPPAVAAPSAVVAPPAMPPPPVAVAPHPGFIPTAAAPPPPAWRGPAGTTHAMYAAAGWSDAQMRANGLLG